MPCPDLVDPCRAKYFRAVPFMIRAVPNISVPCPHDPCPDLVDPCRAAQEGFQKYGAPFCEEKKAPAATYPQVRGFQKYLREGVKLVHPLSDKVFERHGL